MYSDSGYGQLSPSAKLWEFADRGPGPLSLTATHSIRATLVKKGATRTAEPCSIRYLNASQLLM